MAGYIGSKAVSVNTTSATISDDLAVGDDALITGTLTTTAATVFNGGFVANDGSTITTADNTTQLTLESTDTDANSGPLLELSRNVTGANNDFLGQVIFKGKDTAGNSHVFGRISNQIKTATSGSETSRMVLTSAVGASEVSRIDILPTETVFNDDSVDLDFRIESDNNTHALFVQGSDGNVAIGSATPEANTNFVALTVGPGASTGGGQVYVESSSVRGVFGADNNGSDPKTIIGTTTNHPLVFFQNNADVGRFDASENFTIKTGNLVIGTAGKGIDFSNQVVSSATNATTTSELLDHYEEGTWTPVVTGTGADAVTVDANNCVYTKVGRVVVLHFEISNLTNPTNDTFNLGGLPFPPGANHEAIGSMMYQNFPIPGAREQIVVYASPAGYLRFYAVGDNIAWSALIGNALGTSFNIIGSVTYSA